MSESKFILYQTDDGKAAVSLYARDGSVWMNQSQLAELFATSKPNVSMHTSNILEEKELNQNSVVKNYLTTTADGKDYNVAFYSLVMILAIGYRISSPRGIQFRQWAPRNLSEFLIKGFIMDDQHLKNPDGRPDYFDEMLARIRDIRSSKKRFLPEGAESLCLIQRLRQNGQSHSDVLCRSAELVISTDLPQRTNQDANFLSAIDCKIENLTAQIAEIQTFKRGLLQQMFV